MTQPKDSTSRLQSALTGFCDALDDAGFYIGWHTQIRSIGDRLFTSEEINGRRQALQQLLAMREEVANAIEQCPQAQHIIPPLLRARYKNHDELDHVQSRFTPRPEDHQPIAKYFLSITRHYPYLAAVLGQDPNDPFIRFDYDPKTTGGLWPLKTHDEAKSMAACGLMAELGKAAKSTLEGSVYQVDISRLSDTDKEYAAHFFSCVQALYPEYGWERNDSIIKALHLPENWQKTIQGSEALPHPFSFTMDDTAPAAANITATAPVAATTSERLASTTHWISATSARRADNHYGTSYHRTSWGEWEKERADAKSSPPQMLG